MWAVFWKNQIIGDSLEIKRLIKTCKLDWRSSNQGELLHVNHDID